MAFEAFLLATLTFTGIVIVHIALCRILGSESGVKWMFMSFGLYLLVLIAAQIWRQYSFEGFATLLATGGFWALGYAEAFSMLCRGFSLSIMVHLADREETLSSLEKSYGGVGATGLWNKRLLSIQKLGLIKQDGNILSLASPRARWLSKVTMTYKELLNLGKGG